MLPILSELRHAVDMQMALNTCVEEGNFSKVLFYFTLGLFLYSLIEICFLNIYLTFSGFPVTARVFTTSR